MSQTATVTGTLGGMVIRHIQENVWDKVLMVLGPTGSGKSEFQGKIFNPGTQTRNYVKTVKLSKRHSGKISLYRPEIGRTKRPFTFRDVPGDGWDPRFPDTKPIGLKENWWPRWFDVMLERPAGYVICLYRPDIPLELNLGVAAFKFFADHLVKGNYPGKSIWKWLKMNGFTLRNIGDLYTPDKVVLWGNFSDVWARDGEVLRMRDESFYEAIFCESCGKVDCHHKAKRDFHPIFRPFKESLQKLERAGIQTMLWSGSAATMFNMREGLLKMVIE